MKQVIQLKIDVSKISENRLYTGAKGTYLTATLFLGEEDQYGNNGMIVEAVSKQERDSGVKGVILGNAKILGGAVKNTEPKYVEPVKQPVDNNTDLPF